MGPELLVLSSWEASVARSWFMTGDVWYSGHELRTSSDYGINHFIRDGNSHERQYLSYKRYCETYFIRWASIYLSNGF